MAVDLSNRTFMFKETLPVIGNYMSAKFSAKKSSPSGLYFSAIRQVTNTLTFQYVPGTTLITVYNSGWVDDDYRRITFADGVSVSDSLYEWLIQLADEVEDTFLTKTEDLDIVANAIRERSWDYRQLTYPNGYAAAISAIGNRVIGSTVAWNQLRPDDAAGWSVARATVTVTGHKITVTPIVSSSTIKFAGISIVPNHKYLAVGTMVSAESTRGCNIGIYRIISTGNDYIIRMGIIYSEQDDTPFGTIFDSSDDGAYLTFALPTAATTTDQVTFDNVCFTDLTTLFGTTIADYLYTLESNTPGAGVAKFRELYPDDYYPHNAGDLLSVAYGEWPQNTPKTLYGVLDLHDDSWIRYGDIYTNRIVYEQMRVRGFIGTPSDWAYNNIYDFFYTTNRPGGFGYYSDFMPFDKIGPCITDAYPYGGSFDGTQTDPTVDPTLLKDGYWMVGWLPSIYTYQIYVKDSSITSDHLNEFATKNAGKTLIGFTNNRQFVLP